MSEKRGKRNEKGHRSGYQKRKARKLRLQAEKALEDEKTFESEKNLVDIESDDEYRHLYVFLDEGNELPKWFNMWKSGTIKLPLQLLTDDDSYTFKFPNQNVGEDDNFRFVLQNVKVTPNSDKEDKFLVFMNVKVIAKNINYQGYLPLSYHILAPLFYF